jgi:ATP-dependent helicase/nuclease subunit A
MSAATAAPTGLTEQQQAALDARNVSVSLSAGAGCGKTFVLTERFLSHVDPTQVERAELDQIVAITFTDAAAREMRERIRRRCFQRLQAARDEREAMAWQRLMRSMDSARISTIHSFCTQLLRGHAVEAGLDPQFEVLDAASAELMKLETVDDRLRALLLAGDEDVLNLAAKRGLDRVRSDVAALAGPLAIAAIERWRHATVDDVVARWQQYLAEEAAPVAIPDVLSSEEAHRLRRAANPAAASSAKLFQHLEDLGSALQLHASSPTTSEESTASRSLSLGEVTLMLDHLRDMAKVQGKCTAKDWHDAEDYDEYKKACEAFRKRVDKSLLKKSFDEAAAREAAAQGLALMRLVGDVTGALERAKSRRNQLEFDDLLARAHALLTAPANDAIRKQIAGSTQLLMVDEFQDTNPLQVAIIKAFCGDDWRERGLFAVGDFKQSIYRFNGAEPRVSLELRGDLTPQGRLSLTKNFRSQPAVTDFVNAVFHQAFEQYEALVPDRKQTTPLPAIEFLWTPGENSADVGGASGDGVNDAHPATPGDVAKRRKRAGAARDAREIEANWIARRLVQLLGSGDPIVTDVVDREALPRPLRLGDIAILLRTLSDAQVYEEALRAHGLDYYLAGGHAFYSQQEIFDVLNLFRTVASEVDEIALAGALRSPLFSLTDETLYWLVERHKSLNGALAAIDRLPPELDQLESQKVRRAASIISELRLEKDRLLVADLFALAMERTGYDATLLTEFLGPRKAANIEKLIDQARALDRSSPGDLPGFITQLSEFVSRAPKEALAATQSEGDVIRIMTIHYSKGLEFPLVVLPDLDRQRHSGITLPVLHESLGPLVPIPSEEREGLIGIDLYRHAEDVQDLEERRRLLYVACTRAADYLILSSSIDDPEHPKRDLLQLVDGQISLADGTLRQPLPSGYGTPQIRITRERPLIDDEKVAKPRGADLDKLAAKTRELVVKGAGPLPRGSEAIRADVGARRRFSFSQFTGAIALQTDDLLAEGNFEADGAQQESSGGRSGDRNAPVLGSLAHALLERVDLKRPSDVRKLCQSIAAIHPTPLSEKLVDQATALVEQFLQTARAAELAQAPVIRREIEFLLPWPPQIDGDRRPERFFHGFIDCLYQGRDGLWRLIDFKTHRTAGDETFAAVANQYAAQLLVYSLAVEQALGAPPAETVLHMLDSGQEHTFQWNHRERDAAMKHIDGAISALLSN